jgi:N-methylhydantoinase B
MRRWVPLTSAAGGRPGSCNEFLIHHADGSVDQAETHESGVLVTEDDWFQLRLPNGGGFGDPLDRAPESVADDLSANRYTPEEARTTYGVVLDGNGMVDLVATERARSELRAARLQKANPPRVPFSQESAPDASDDATWPLQPGVVQRGSIAFAEASGTPLAVAPHHWTDGCPVLIEPQWSDAGGPPVEFRTYLDPGTGRSLHVEVALADVPRSFEVSPTRWTAGGRVPVGL